MPGVTRLEIVRCIRYSFISLGAGVEYCRKVASMGGADATEYAAAADLIESSLPEMVQEVIPEYVQDCQNPIVQTPMVGPMTIRHQQRTSNDF